MAKKNSAAVFTVAALWGAAIQAAGEVHAEAREIMEKISLAGTKLISNKDTNGQDRHSLELLLKGPLNLTVPVHHMNGKTLFVNTPIAQTDVPVGSLWAGVPGAGVYLARNLPVKGKVMQVIAAAMSRMDEQVYAKMEEAGQIVSRQRQSLDENGNPQQFDVLVVPLNQIYPEGIPLGIFETVSADGKITFEPTFSLDLDHQPNWLKGKSWQRGSPTQNQAKWFRALVEKALEMKQGEMTIAQILASKKGLHNPRDFRINRNSTGFVRNQMQSQAPARQEFSGTPLEKELEL